MLRARMRGRMRFAFVLGVLVAAAPLARAQDSLDGIPIDEAHPLSHGANKTVYPILEPDGSQSPDWLLDRHGDISMFDPVAVVKIGSQKAAAWEPKLRAWSDPRREIPHFRKRVEDAIALRVDLARNESPRIQQRFAEGLIVRPRDQ